MQKIFFIFIHFSAVVSFSQMQAVGSDQLYQNVYDVYKKFILEDNKTLEDLFDARSVENEGAAKYYRQILEKAHPAGEIKELNTLIKNKKLNAIKLWCENFFEKKLGIKNLKDFKFEGCLKQEVELVLHEVSLRLGYHRDQVHELISGSPFIITPIKNMIISGVLAMLLLMLYITADQSIPNLITSQSAKVVFKVLSTVFFVSSLSVVAVCCFVFLVAALLSKRKPKRIKHYFEKRIKEIEHILETISRDNSNDEVIVIET